MDSNLFEARVRDTADLTERTCVPHFFGFLTESEKSQAITVLEHRNIRYELWGGYEQAERTFLACLPDWCEKADFPFKAYTFKFRSCDKLSHRDFLGSLMALGITRESVGDILTEDGRAVVFIADDVSRFVETQILKIGRVGVEITEGFKEPLPNQGELKAFSVTVASLRLDAVVSALVGCSRNQAAELIESGTVSVNSVICEKCVRQIKSGDSVTVRGKGKFFTDSADEHSKKGRIILKYSKYV